MSRCQCEDKDVFDTLCENIGKICSVFTERGEFPFTGVVSAVDNETCRLIAADGFDRRGGCRGRFRFDGFGVGTVLTIPLDKITCVSTLQF